MRRIEQEAESTSSFNTLSTIKAPGRFEELKLSQADIEEEFGDLIEFDNANRRWRNRILYLSISTFLSEDRFVYDKDKVEDEDVSYLTDLQFSEDMDTDSLVRLDEREDHNRVVFLNREGKIAVVEFFNSSQGLDLTGLEVEDEVIRTLVENGSEIILNPQNPKE